MADQNKGMGARIANLREARGLRQRELADLAGLSVSFLSDIENEKRTIGSEALLRIADALKASLDYLLRGDAPSARFEPVVIPVNLSEAARKMGWSYPQTEALLNARRIRLANRTSDGGVEKTAADYTADDWIAFYDRFFGHD